MEQYNEIEKTSPEVIYACLSIYLRLVYSKLLERLEVACAIWSYRPCKNILHIRFFYTKACLFNEHKVLNPPQKFAKSTRLVLLTDCLFACLSFCLSVFYRPVQFSCLYDWLFEVCCQALYLLVSLLLFAFLVEARNQGEKWQLHRHLQKVSIRQILVIDCSQKCNKLT